MIPQTCKARFQRVRLEIVRRRKAEMAEIFVRNRIGRNKKPAPADLLNVPATNTVPVNACTKTVEELPNPTRSTSGLSRSHIRTCEDIQLRLCLLGQAGEQHGNPVTDVLIAGAINHHAGAMDFAVPRRSQSYRHFSPGRKRSRAAEFNAALVNSHRISAKLKPRLPCLKCYRLE